MNKKFLQVCLGLSMVLLSASVFVYSINPAKAANSLPSPQNFTSSGSNKAGEYNLVITVDGANYNYWLVNTENGKTYKWDNKGSWKDGLPPAPMQ
ncbi:MAG: hypothetical protein ACLQQ4_13960 [Bacteroidia bacterium]